MCTLGALITITSYFCLKTIQYIHVVVYSECLITDARVMPMYIWASDTPNTECVLTEDLFTDDIELPSEFPHIQNVFIFHLYFGVF